MLVSLRHLMATRGWGAVAHCCWPCMAGSCLLHGDPLRASDASPSAAPASAAQEARGLHDAVPL